MGAAVEGKADAAAIEAVQWRDCGETQRQKGEEGVKDYDSIEEKGIFCGR
jgi:hypothetical protein